MISTLLLLTNLAWADTCKYQNIDFDFGTTDRMNRTVDFKDLAKTRVPFPAAPEGLAVNLAKAASEGSVCANAGVYPMAPGKLAVLFESVGADSTATFAALLDVKAKTFGGAVLLAQSSDLSVKKTARGFAFDNYIHHVDTDSLATGVGPAAGLDMVVQQNDLWKSAELGPKGLTVTFDKDLTWEHSRWKKYFSKRPDFEKALRMDKDPSKTRLFFAFSREKKKDCIMIDYSGDKSAFCTPMTAASLTAPYDDDPEKE